MHKEYNFMNKKYSEEEIRNFIKKYPEKCDFWFWVYISKYQDLSDDFIRDFQGSVDWLYISADQNLSENFIREFQDKVDWFDISWKEDLSEKFLIEFIDKIDSTYLKYNGKLPEKIKNRIINLKKVQNG